MDYIDKNLPYILKTLGYKYDEIYPLTDEKIDQIYKKMDEVKPHINVWWKAGAQPAQLLVDKEVVMASAWNGRIEKVIREGAPIKIVWNGGALQGDSWVIPKGAPNKDLAMLFATKGRADELKTGPVWRGLVWRGWQVRLAQPGTQQET